MLKIGIMTICLVLIFPTSALAAESEIRLECHSSTTRKDGEKWNLTGIYVITEQRVIVEPSVLYSVDKPGDYIHVTQSNIFFGSHTSSETFDIRIDRTTGTYLEEIVSPSGKETWLGSCKKSDAAAQKF